MFAPVRRAVTRNGLKGAKRMTQSNAMPAFAAGARQMSTTHRVLCFPGDGVGPEIVDSANQVLEKAGVNIDWTYMDMGFEAQQKTGHTITEAHLQAFEDIKVCFKGPLTIPPSASNSYIEIRDRKFTSANQVLRKIYNLYANIRPAKSIVGVNTPFKDIDLVVVRENTEDLYTGEEEWVDADTVHGIKRISRKATSDIARVAFKYALKNKRSRITCVHKANVCKQADGLFLSACTDIAEKEFRQSGITFDDHLADSLCTKLVINPNEYDILLCPNLFGDIMSDLAAGLIGSLGLCPSMQLGEDMAVFEPCHGSAPDIAGKGIVNPTSQIRCAVLMAEYFGQRDEAQRIEAAVCNTISEGKALTADLGGTSSTSDFTKAVLSNL